MPWTAVLASWNPNKYTILRERSFGRTAGLVTLVALVAVVVFALLALPSVFQSNEVVQELARTTNITLNGTFEQSAPTYVAKNPDVLVTAGEGDGFITVTPAGLRVKYFVFFGEHTYPWLPLMQLRTWPAESLLVPIALFILPSFIIWGTVVALLNILLGAFVFASVTALAQQVRGYHVRYAELWKISIFASIPGLLLFAVTPILRLGLPLSIIVGLIFVLWLTLALLATAALAEKHPSEKFSPREPRERTPSKRA